MNDLLALGIDAFEESIKQEVAELQPGARVRAGGRPTKANPGGEDLTWWKQQGPAFIQSWITWRQQNPSLHMWSLDADTPAIELPVSAEVDVDGETVELKGFIDRVFVDAVTGQLLIVDLKTGKSTPEPLQLAFYRRALAATHGVQAQYGAYWMARKGTLSDIADLDSFDDATVDYWVATTVRGIRNNVFLPRVSPMCSGCGVREHCYVFNKNTPFSPIDSNIHQVMEASK